MIRLVDAYPGKAAGVTIGYPHGSARNITTAGDGTGTPFERQWLNDIQGFFQAIMSRADVTPNGTPDSVTNAQILNALLRLRWKQNIDDSVGAFDGEVKYIFWPREENGPLLGGEYIWAADATDTPDTVNFSVIQVTGVATGRWLRLYDRRLRDGIHEPLVALASEVSGVLPLTQQWAVVRKFDIIWGGFPNVPYSHCTVMQTATVPVLLEGETDTYAYKKFTKLVIQGFSGTSNAVSLAGTTAIPLAYRPIGNIGIPGVAIVGSDYVPCMISITASSGVITVDLLNNGTYDGSFPATGTKGIHGDFTFFYETTL